MRNKLFIFFFLIFVLVPFIIFPVTLVRVGYIDLDIIIETYTGKYLDTEISIREDYVLKLQGNYNQNYFTFSEEERSDILLQLKDQRNVLSMLRYNKFLWESTEDIRDDIIYQIVQRDIMEAIKKTSELEGYSLILDNTGNFIYGSNDINLTDKVLFRLDEKLLDLQNNEPVAPLILELEENLEIF